MVLFWQTLQGLAAIYSLNVMYRDISPWNLLIEDLQTPKACICDFSKAKACYMDKELEVNPLHTLAPEVSRHVYYSSAINIWSLAYIWLWIYKKRDDNVHTDSERHISLVKTVDNLSKQGRIIVDFAYLLH